MEIIKKLDSKKLEIALVGRLDTTTAPSLENELTVLKDGITELIFDFEKLEYISSAGLRVLLSAQKIMNVQGSMVIRNASEDVKSVFEITGFTSILTLE